MMLHFQVWSVLTNTQGGRKLILDGGAGVMTKNYIFQNSQILLYKIPKDGGAKAPSAPPVPPTLEYSNRTE